MYIYTVRTSQVLQGPHHFPMIGGLRIESFQFAFSSQFFLFPNLQKMFYLVHRDGRGPAEVRDTRKRDSIQHAKVILFFQKRSSFKRTI